MPKRTTSRSDKVARPKGDLAEQPVYNKLLVARHHPDQGCNAKSGAVLTVRPLSKVPLTPYVEHHFVSANDSMVTSSYGWTKTIRPFTLDEFAETYLGGRTLSAGDRKHLEILFSTIARLPAGTAVSAEYTRLGSQTQRMAFAVHRIIYIGR